MGTKEKIESLLQRKAKIEKEIAAVKARETAKSRKEETHLKVLIGAAMLADANINPNTVEIINDILTRAITAPRDKEFLQNKGWLKDEKTTSGQ